MYNDPFNIVIPCGEVLKSIHFEYEDVLNAGPIVAILEFESILIFVNSVPDFDTVNVGVKRQEAWPIYESFNAGQSMDLRRFIGMELNWAWLLKNQLGFADGVQFEFVSQDAKYLEAIQFVCAAAVLSIRILGYYSKRGNYSERGFYKEDRQL